MQDVINLLMIIYKCASITYICIIHTLTDVQYRKSRKQVGEIIVRILELLLLHTSHFLITEKPPFGLSPAQHLNWNKEQRNKKRRQTNIKCYHKRKDVDKEIRKINEEKVSRMSQRRKEQKRSLQQKEEEKENGRKREREWKKKRKRNEVLEQTEFAT